MNNNHIEELKLFNFFPDNKLSIIGLKCLLALKNPYITLSSLELETVDILDGFIFKGELDRNNLKFSFRFSRFFKDYKFDGIHYYIDQKYVTSSQIELLKNDRWISSSFKILIANEIVHSVYLF